MGRSLLVLCKFQEVNCCVSLLEPALLLTLVDVQNLSEELCDAEGRKLHQHAFKEAWT